MFKESNRIVLIDDNASDLEQLSKVFYDNGIGCRTFLYDSFYNTPLLGIKILFLDINLSGAQSDQQRNSTLRDAIIHYVHEENGPFVLVLWTNNTQWIDSFKVYVNRSVDADLYKRFPYYFTNIDKNEFYDKQKDLEEKIKSIFNNSVVSTLFDFEESLSLSASKTISQIISIIPKGESWGDDKEFYENLQKVFSTIAVQTAGYNKAKENPDRAIKEAIIPILANAFVQEEHTIWGEVLNNLKFSTNKSEIFFPKSFNEARLNSIFHINDNVANNYDRGAVCPLLFDLKKTTAFNDKFGFDFKDWFSCSFPDVTKEERDQSQLVCVEFSAACDYSQNKRRTNKYLLGELLPVSSLEKMEKSQRKGDFLLLLPYKFDIQGKEQIIAFNLNFTFTIDPSAITQTLGEPLFCFKKEMMDLIGSKYADHISRIGITTFR